MADEEKYINSGLIFKNPKPKNANSPAYYGKSLIEIEGECPACKKLIKLQQNTNISMWLKQGKRGKFMTLLLSKLIPKVKQPVKPDRHSPDDPKVR